MFSGVTWVRGGLISVGERCSVSFWLLFLGNGMFSFVCGMASVAVSICVVQFDWMFVCSGLGGLCSSGIDGVGVGLLSGNFHFTMASSGKRQGGVGSVVPLSSTVACWLVILIQACSLLDSLLEFKLAVIFCCEPSHGLHDHPPPTPCTQFNESGRRFFYIK